MDLFLPAFIDPSTWNGGPVRGHRSDGYPSWFPFPISPRVGLGLWPAREDLRRRGTARLSSSENSSAGSRPFRNPPGSPPRRDMATSKSPRPSLGFWKRPGANCALSQAKSHLQTQKTISDCTAAGNERSVPPLFNVSSCSVYFLLVYFVTSSRFYLIVSLQKNEAPLGLLVRAALQLLFFCLHQLLVFRSRRSPPIRPAVRSSFF
jgi:hypothetical protein